MIAIGLVVMQWARWARGLATGSTAAGVAVAACALAACVGGVMIWHLIDPPPVTYTSAEIEAAQLRRELESFKRAHDERARAEARQKQQTETAVAETEQLRGQIDALAKQTPGRGTPAVPADDPWLRRAWR